MDTELITLLDDVSGGRLVAEPRTRTLRWTHDGAVHRTTVAAADVRRWLQKLTFERTEPSTASTLAQAVLDWVAQLTASAESGFDPFEPLEHWIIAAERTRLRRTAEAAPRRRTTARRPGARPAAGPRQHRPVATSAVRARRA
mgnify:CR=1 FL=1